MFVFVEKNYKIGYAIFTIKKEPVNLLDLALVKELNDTFTDLENDKKIRGVIITSGLKRNLFTAGNDISELYAPKTTRERFCEFWTIENKFLIKLLKTRLTTIAAIRGYSPAGGCIISLCCDYRFITENGSIGLNEVALGISVPKYWIKLFLSIVGSSLGRYFLLSAKILNASQALNCKLVHEIVDEDKLLMRTISVMEEFLKNPDFGKITTKNSIFEDFVKEWESYLDEESEMIWNFLSSDAVINKLKLFFQRNLETKSKL